MMRNIDLEIDLLWQKFLDGDDSSLDRLYSKYIQVLFVYGLQFTVDRELVKDCIQDIFVKIYETKTQHRHVKNILVYLHIGLKNRIFNAQKRDMIHAKYVNSLEASPIDEFTAEHRLEWIEEEQHKRNMVEAIMKLLTPQQKKVVQYRYIEDLSLEEISIILKINYQSVQNVLQRAINKIKKHFVPEK